jgi:hypothetical protein
MMMSDKLTDHFNDNHEIETRESESGSHYSWCATCQKRVFDIP